jgi:polysaccharide chain length determinant protein (PEP-CTERM system associated)
VAEGWRFEEGEEGMAIHRDLTWEDYLAILRRRRWLIIISAILGVGAGYFVSLLLPSGYTSHTVVLVEQPTVSDSYVKPVVSVNDLNQRLASMKEQILSRTRLQTLVEKYALYQKDAKQVPMEQFVERLRKSVKVTPLTPMPGTRAVELPGFNVDVTLEKARLAQQICTEISSMFMEQSLRLQRQQVDDTAQFLGKQLEQAKANLDDQDAKLAAFQSRYIGELPDDEKNNLTLLMGMTPELEAATQSLHQAQQEGAFTESLLNQQLATWKASQQREDPQSLEQLLSNERTLLLSLQGRYTEQHPDVVKAKGEIARLQNKIQEASAEDQGPSEPKAKAPLNEPPQIQQLRAQLHQADLAISQRKHEQEQLQRQVRILQSRVQLSPMIQQEFKALTRDRQTALDFYNDLLKKRNESEMAAALERRQQGEQFRVLDPPSLPERPSFPNRPLFSLGGLAAGLAVGLGMVQLAELRDKSMRTKRDIEIYLRVPTLALISSFDPTTPKQTRISRDDSEQTELSLPA